MILLLCRVHQCNLLVGDYLVHSQHQNTVNRAVKVIKWFNNHSSALDLLQSEQVTTYPECTSAPALLLSILT